MNNSRTTTSPIINGITAMNSGMTKVWLMNKFDNPGW